MDFKKILFGITGTILCIGGYVAFSVETKEKLKNLVLEKKQSKTPDIEMLTINQAIEMGYSSDSFDLTQMSIEDNRKFDITPLKPYLDKGLSFDAARLKLVEDKIKNIPD